MHFKQLAFGVLAIQGVSAINLTEKSEALSTEGTEWKLKDANEKIGNIKYQRPHDPEVFDLGAILNDFYSQVGMKYGDKDFGTFTYNGAPYRYGILPIDPLTDPYKKIPALKEFEVNPNGPTKFQHRIPEVHYPDPKPYSYSVTQPSIVYREVDHIPPAGPYETPSFDLAAIETYPEGYTNEYDDLYAERYLGSDGTDHAHYLYDNVDDIDFDHGHFDPDPHARVHPIQPDVNNYFVPVVNGPYFEADYDDPYFEKVDPITLETYTDKLGVQRYLYNDEIAEGAGYTPDAQREEQRYQGIEHDLYYVEP